MLWVPFLVGIAMFIAGLWMVLRVDKNVSSFEHDCMCVRDHETRLLDIEAGIRQLQHSGEIPALEDTSWMTAPDGRMIST